ncbi:MAG: hypothetical protein GXO25_07755 [Euryarchaeota archaeon]|uniref:Uncharacterized protein n=1 Tax=uncultured euryarchaeote Alv-FOS4 TaxID=337893 RepID=Q3SA54_9EURY|nr:hypothetical protein [uncultured euryarchaeote Alv-FOS4]NPA75954.1 hypothetical protein [Euryarchaeota archaeon]
MQSKNLEKTLEARDVTLLRALLHMSIKKLKEEGNIDLILFVGVNGRIFDSLIPERLDTKEYYLLNQFKSNLHKICAQLMSKSMKISIETYDAGTMIIALVGDAAFLTLMITRELNHEDMRDVISSVNKWTVIVNHIFQLKPLSGPETEEYPEEIKKELHGLSRQLFVERFEYTKQYRKNQKILEYLKKELAGIVGIGMVDEILTISFNEMGIAPQYMKDDLWPILVERVCDKIRSMRGDVIADEYYKKWIRDIERLIRTFV